MTIHLILSFGCSLLLFFLPWRCWQFILSRFRRIYSLGKMLIWKFLIKLEIHRPDDLVFQLIELEGVFSCGRLNLDHPLYQYKFYTKLVELVLDLGRQYGVPVRRIIKTIRQGLSIDLRFEKKTMQSLKDGYAQFILVTFVNWFFAWMVQKIVMIHISFMIKAIVLVLQIGGSVFFLLIYVKVKSSCFKIFDGYFQTIYAMRALVEVGLGTEDILLRSGVSSLLSDTCREFDVLRERLARSINLWRYQGVPILDELSDMIDELWFMLENRHEVFIKKLNFLKFIVLVVFYLSSYFIYLFNLMVVFLVE